MSSLTVNLRSTELCPDQFLEQVSDPLLEAPLLDSGQQPVIEVSVDLVELGHLEEDGIYLSQTEDRLRRGSRRLQRLHWLHAEQRRSVIKRGGADWAPNVRCNI